MKDDLTPALDAITHEAASWYYALREAGADASVRVQFTHWLRQSPQHVEEYLRVCGTDRMLRDRDAAPTHSTGEVLAALDGATNVVPLSGGRAPIPVRNRARRALRAAAAMAAVVATVTVLVPWLRSAPRAQTQTYATAAGEQRTWMLTDGSRIVLDTDSRLVVAFGARERRVDVMRGRAFFQVAKDPARHFRVTAGGPSIVALGTRFDVERRGPSTLVRLAEGRVALYAHYDDSAGDQGSGSPADAELHPGEQAALAPTGIERPTPVSPAQIEAWPKGQLMFDQKPIAEVAMEANRYLPIPVFIDDPGFGARRISGSLAIGDTDSFLAFLRASADIVIERTPSRIRVYRRGHAGGAATGAGAGGPPSPP